jgi:hypothetical protein
MKQVGCPKFPQNHALCLKVACFCKKRGKFVRLNPICLGLIPNFGGIFGNQPATFLKKLLLGAPKPATFLKKLLLGAPKPATFLKNCYSFFTKKQHDL